MSPTPVAGSDVEPPLAVDATCADPDYNEGTFVVDSKQQLVYTDPSGQTIPYTEVKGHFPATNTPATLPSGVRRSPTLNQQDVVWRFPAREFWQNRSFQHTYPLQGTGPADLNEVDLGFAFTNGAFTVKVNPGNPTGGYRVNAAATKLAKAYANQHYGNSTQINSYLWGQSGGSGQALGAAEGTTGIWAGVIPAVIVTTGLTWHSFQWQAHYALAVPLEKRSEVRQAAEVGSGRSIYDPLDVEQRSVLDELLKGGFPRLGLGTALTQDLVTGGEVPVGDATVGSLVGPFPGVAGPSLVYGPGATAIRALDPTYEDDFWSKPGYAGANPPNYLTGAKVDGFATITEIVRDAQGVPTALKFDPATVPALGSIGARNLDYYVYDADGTTRTIDTTNPASPVFTLTGTLDTTTSTLALPANPNVLSATAPNSRVLLDALDVGDKIRINNRFFLAYAHYPRHSILDNGNPAYNQYKDKTGKPKYPQREIQLANISSLAAMGGIKETGNIKTKVMVMENLEDANSYPSVAGFYQQQVEKTLGKRKADEMFRVYYQEHAGHSNGGLVQGIFNQMVLDLVAWAEQGVAPKPSSSYTIDSMTQVVQPHDAVNRKGLQPVVHLTANGGDRAEASLLQPVNLSATIEMPPTTGKILQYSWTIERQGVPAVTEPATVLPTPTEKVTLTRPITLPGSGEYVVTLNTIADRNGTTGTSTPLQNFDRVRVVVR
ncbi:tannase/feruloyl esterase family alpha/beta hydrolase [Arthrobacter rhizosphaerae]|uniref:tannase/feruloyl esterase family alpha/beta hydrolase n=1 Tax=Arthrobacter rhizosphaerae TaxID=2855490 RepID=UPI001FF20CA4|nr:tannase/feruloyl esterase family alpha/beta hydrolase [Arthrobacter rhizosphaerae]